MTTRRWMAAIVGAAAILLGVRSITYPTLWMEGSDETVIGWSDGTTERHPRRVPRPRRWDKYPLWWLVRWTDGSTSIHLAYHLDWDARRWLFVAAGTTATCAGGLWLRGRIRPRPTGAGEPPGGELAPDA